MLVKSLVALMLLSGSVCFANPVDTKSPSELAELGVHKLERLTSGANPQVEKSFQSQTTEIQVVPEGSNTKISCLQGEAADGSRKTATITLMNDGMIMGSASNEASMPASPLQLPGLNAITYLEYSLHCIQGEDVGTSQLCANTAALRIFADKLTRVALTSAGDSITVEIFGVALPQKAVLTFKADGTLSDQNPIQFVNL